MADSLMAEVVGSVAEKRSAEAVAFNRDIRPILADRCFACHGPDQNQRKAELRLDTEAGLLGSDGTPGVIVAKELDNSELFRRITAKDLDERMPPAEFGKPLSETQIDLVARWIEQGANWEGHWSFQPVRECAPPAVDTHTAEAFFKNEIDAFTYFAMSSKGLHPAPEADQRTLARRLSFDLVGLPPEAELVESFQHDDSPTAYENLVDDFLASPHFGERMAMWWLDLVRYADSVGYHGDQPVSVSPFRDYVIQAFNSNKPFDEFTREQLAGDLLPEPTREQRIASGYNRLGMMSAEGGVQPKEYLAKYIAERVRNLGGTWLGVTLGCCECHDHKYDPLSSKEFYRLEAFFADIDEQGLYAGNKWGNEIALPTEEQSEQLSQMELKVAQARQELETPTEEFQAAQKAWERSAEGLDKELAAIVAKPAEERKPDEAQRLTAHYRSIAPQLADQRKRVALLEKQRDLIKSQIPTTLVTRTVEPRMIRVLHRGNWMDEKGEVVDPGFPQIFGPQLDLKRRLTRLDLADWIVSRDNPLTARVIVNRLWKIFFGAGLSPRLDDFGSQGQWPTHPELLDALAIEFVKSGWNVKELVKKMVMSGTYRQASKVSKRASQIDPSNQWLSHQARFRLDAEMVRDNLLAVSGLLVDDIGGASVKPYQPPGYWAYLNFPQREWENGKAQQLYRRGLYTHWQRQYLHPSLQAFDAPSREECTADRSRSNTPLQSLVLLNDPSYVEAARALAERVLSEAAGDDDHRIVWVYRRTLSRSPSEEETKIVRDLLTKHRVAYKDDVESAKALRSIGDKTVQPELDPVELAAWTSVTRVVFNLHETITRN